MKRIFFVRHGKSSWSDPYLEDLHRPLKKRGLKDAKSIAKILSKEGYKIDQIFSSDAKRARQTAKVFIEKLKVSNVSYHNELYHAGLSKLKNFISTIPENVNTVMFFGHNPTYTDAINEFSDEYFFNVPTAGCFMIELEDDDWNAISWGGAKLKEYWFPRDFK